MIIDYSIEQLNKQDQILSGDSFEVIEDENSKCFILSDGLGSGVKANISSTYTKIILSKFLQNDVDLKETVRVLKNIIPTCKERGFGYSTFTIIQIFSDLKVKIIEYDNPSVFYFSNKQSKGYEKQEFDIENKKIYISEFQANSDDILVLASDGLTQAGRGKNVRNGWGRVNITKFIEKNISLPITVLCESLVFHAQMLENKEIKDDISVITIQIRSKVPLNIAIGLPESKTSDKQYIQDFFKKSGKKIVCGGSTAQFFSRALDSQFKTDQKKNINDIPSKYFVEGIDLATEGMLTLNKVLSWYDHTKEYVYEYEHINSLHNIKNLYSKKTSSNYTNAKEVKIKRNKPQNPVDEMILHIKKSDEINLFIGKAQNPAYKNMQMSSKFDVISELIKKLTSLKKVVNVYNY